MNTTVVPSQPPVCAEGLDDDYLVPWHTIICSVTRGVSALGALGDVLSVLLTLALALLVVSLGIGLLSKNANMYFAPSLEDLCSRCNVKARTASACFIAIANGAPDLASTASMFAKGDSRSTDMGYGALFGAGAYVCMYVVGLIMDMPLKPPHSNSIQVNAAMCRDVLGYLALLLAMVIIFVTKQLGAFVVVVSLTGYVALLAAIVYFDHAWQRAPSSDSTLTAPFAPVPELELEAGSPPSPPPAAGINAEAKRLAQAHRHRLDRHFEAYGNERDGTVGDVDSPAEQLISDDSSHTTITPLDSVSQQGQHYTTVLGSSVQALQVDDGARMSERERVALEAWNNIKDIVHVVFPPCDEPDDSDTEDEASTHAAPAEQPRSWSAWAADCAASAIASFEMPDYLTFFDKYGSGREARHGRVNVFHLLLLALGFVPMLLMRLTVPTVTDDFFTWVIFPVSMFMAPVTTSYLFGLGWPLQYLAGLGAMLFVISCTALYVRGLDLPAAFREPGLLNTIAYFSLNCLTMIVAVAWIGMIANELVGCWQATGELLSLPGSLLGFVLAVVNSLGDQETNLSFARKKGKRGAIAACFSGMTFNFALGPFLGWLKHMERGTGSGINASLSSSTVLLWACLAVYLAASSITLLCMYKARLVPGWGRYLRLTFLATTIVLVGTCIPEWLSAV